MYILQIFYTAISKTKFTSITNSSNRKILIPRINNIKIQMYMLVYRVMIKYKSILRPQRMMKSLFENVKGMHTGI